MNIALHKHGRMALWIATYLFVGWMIGRATSDNVQGWYQGLNKPELNPPDFVFPVVWTLLYVMIAVAGAKLFEYRKSPEGRVCCTLFVIQTAMNWLWSFIFFEWHMLDVAFGWILALVLVVAVLILKASSHVRIAAYLLVPYLFWIAFASYLSGFIWLNN
jgi:tryptophan-rich sensory protein